MYEPTTYRYPFGPSPVPKGLGQAMCPSVNQMLGCLDTTDPCCAASASNAPFIAGAACYNTGSGTNVPCPTSGTVQTTSPAGTGPLGTMSVSNLNWGVLAAVLVGLVVFAGATGK
jgi:hypothetical protein